MVNERKPEAVFSAQQVPGALLVCCRARYTPLDGASKIISQAVPDAFIPSFSARNERVAC
jgi:hypothetical protein